MTDRQLTMADALTLSPDTFAERLSALLPFCQTGPGYNRSVRSKVADAQLFAGRAEWAAATHYLLLGECAAGFISWEQYLEIDPFKQETRTASVYVPTHITDTGE